MGMNNYRQRIAEELLAKEPEIRASLFGKIVWRNWRMDKYKTRRGEWFSLGKAEDPVNNGTGTKGLALTGNGASTFTDTSSAGVLKTAIQVRFFTSQHHISIQTALAPNVFSVPFIAFSSRNTEIFFIFIFFSYFLFFLSFCAQIRSHPIFPILLPSSSSNPHRP